MVTAKTIWSSPLGSIQFFEIVQICFKCWKTRIQRTNQSPTKTISIFYAVKQINKIPRKDRLRYEIRIFQYRSLYNVSSLSKSTAEKNVDLFLRIYSWIHGKL
jgi:hypothetical protein